MWRRRLRSLARARAAWRSCGGCCTACVHVHVCGAEGMQAFFLGSGHARLAHFVQCWHGTRPYMLSPEGVPPLLPMPPPPLACLPSQPVAPPTPCRHLYVALMQHTLGSAASLLHLKHGPPAAAGATKASK